VFSLSGVQFFYNPSYSSQDLVLQEESQTNQGTISVRFLTPEENAEIEKLLISCGVGVRDNLHRFSSLFEHYFLDDNDLDSMSAFATIQTFILTTLFNKDSKTIALFLDCVEASFVSKDFGDSMQEDFEHQNLALLMFSLDTFSEERLVKIVAQSIHLVTQNQYRHSGIKINDVLLNLSLAEENKADKIVLSLSKISHLRCGDLPYLIETFNALPEEKYDEIVQCLLDIENAYSGYINLSKVKAWKRFADLPTKRKSTLVHDLKPFFNSPSTGSNVKEGCNYSSILDTVLGMHIEQKK